MMQEFLRWTAGVLICCAILFGLIYAIGLMVAIAGYPHLLPEIMTAFSAAFILTGVYTL